MSRFIRRSRSLANINLSSTLRNEMQPPLEANGLGCPNEWECDSRCRVDGARGGYCDAWTLWTTCKCY
ncbi:actinodefensin [Actinomyces naeslundii]|uniref:actinodefensin n=1 Tax=Actinomyces naeslundii TaxID=1655 RepID=UPI001177CC6F